MPEHLDSALLSALVLLGLTCVIGGKQADTASATELGCLQLLATGQKDLPPVHVCRYAAQTGLAPSPDVPAPITYSFHCLAVRSRERMESSRLSHSATMLNQNTSMLSQAEMLQCLLSCQQAHLFSISHSWIVLWQESGDAAQASSVAACKEAESETAGRFKGKCTASFTSIFNGLSIQVCSAVF